MKFKYKLNYLGQIIEKYHIPPRYDMHYTGSCSLQDRSQGQWVSHMIIHESLILITCRAKLNNILISKLRNELATTKVIKCFNSHSWYSALKVLMVQVLVTDSHRVFDTVGEGGGFFQESLIISEKNRRLCSKRRAIGCCKRQYK